MADPLVRVKILKQTTACKQIARKDDVIDVPKDEASFLVGQGQAELAPKATLKKNPKEIAKVKKSDKPETASTAPATGAESIK